MLLVHSAQSHALQQQYQKVIEKKTHTHKVHREQDKKKNQNLWYKSIKFPLRKPNIIKIIRKEENHEISSRTIHSHTHYAYFTECVIEKLKSLQPNVATRCVIQK